MNEEVAHREVAASEAACREALLSLAAKRGSDGTFCPSEAARTVGGDEWRTAMPGIQAALRRLVASGQLRATQRGRPVDPVNARGPIRLGLPQAKEDDDAG